MSESIIRILIYTHAAFGATALLAGLVALVTAKGNPTHILGGKVFYYVMLCTALLAMIVSVQPGHVNPFLFVIAVFSSYMILSGKRILHMKQLYTGMQPERKDYILPWAMVVAGFIMIAYGIILKFYHQNSGIVLVVFGSIGMLMARGDLNLLRRRPTDKHFWLYQHISKMTGGYIAAVTAFLVVNQALPGLWGWLTPTAVGMLYIIYHQRRFRSPKGQQILADRKIALPGESIS